MTDPQGDTGNPKPIGGQSGANDPNALPDRTETLWKILGRFDALIGATNTKATLLLGFNTFLIGTIGLKWTDIRGFFGGSSTLAGLAAALLVGAIVTALVSIWHAVRAIQPYLGSLPSSEDYRSALFFKHIAERSPAEYSAQVEGLDAAGLRRDLTYQAHALARGLDGKYQSLNYAVRSLFVELVVLGVALALLLVSSVISPAQSTGARTVGILNLGPYPLMTDVANECRNTLEHDGEIQIKVRLLDANFDQEILRRQARQLADGGDEVLVAVTTSAAQSLIAENEGRKPLVFTFVSTPSALGWTAPGSLANVTGLVDKVPVDRTLDIIQEILGPTARIGYMVNDTESSAGQTYVDFRAGVKAKGLELRKVPVLMANDVRIAAQNVVDKVDCYLVGPDSLVTGAIDSLLQVADAKKRPVFCTDPISVKRGCLAAVAPNYEGMGRKTATYVKAILKGAPPGALPVVDFTDYLPYVNTKMADRLGIHLPEKVLKSPATRFVTKAD